MKNFYWARKVWSSMSHMLRREGAPLRVSGFFLKTVVQAVLLFGAQTWLVTPRTGKYLRVFQT